MMYSAHYDKNFEVAMTSYSENGKEVVIISHDALEDIIHNQIPVEEKVMYDFQCMTVNPNIPVICCTICDKRGRRVQAIGEATPRSLTTEIAKAYPTLMASQRAFDRAAIRFLNFPGKIYSNMEITDGDISIEEDMIEPVEERPVENTGISVKEEVVEEKPPFVAAPISTKSEVKEEVKTEEKVDTKTEPETEEKVEAPVEDGYGSVVINMGKYKGKNKTIAELYNEDYNWLSYISTMTGVNGFVKDQVTAAAKYIEQHPAK